ncbi:MAG: GtrA family protein [Rhodospirillaceae bacterium]|jgi:putative flippase GtrA|nr:GtrA family protein [Rhodospirillaceae bacterium]
MRLTGKKRRVSKLEIKAFLAGDLGRAVQKYLLVGGASALIEWALFAIAFYGLGLHHLVSGGLSFLLAVGVNYWLSVRFVFGTGRRARKQRIFLLYLVSAIGLGFNLIILEICISYLELNAMIAKIAATGMVLGWNFSARYYFIFQK